MDIPRDVKPTPQPLGIERSRVGIRIRQFGESNGVATLNSNALIDVYDLGMAVVIIDIIVGFMDPRITLKASQGVRDIS